MNRKSIMLLLLSILLSPIISQAQSAKKSEAANYSQYEGLTIDSIIIDNQNVYDNSGEYSNFLFRLANRFHLVTRKSVIRKELIFKIGDILDPAIIEETARNIRKNLMIYDVKIEIIQTDNNNVSIKVITIDQWSSTGGISISREGNESELRFGVLEKNLLGYNYLFLFDYVTQSDEDDYIRLMLSKKRWGKHQHEVTIIHDDNPQSKIKSISLIKPFYNLTQKHAYYLSPGLFTGRDDYYIDQYILGESNFENDQFQAGYYLKRGDNNQAFIYELHYRYNYEKNHNTKIFSNSSLDSSYVLSQLPDDSLNHELTLGLSYNQYNFFSTSQIDGFNYTEDIDVGYRVSLQFGRAFDNKFNNHSYDKINLTLRRNLRLSNNFILFQSTFQYRFNGAEELNKSLIIKSAYYNRLSSKLTFAAAGDYLSVIDNRYYNSLTLDGINDLRGFNKHFRSGSKKAVLHFELRYNSGLSFLTTIIGAALFADFGQIWKKNEPFNFNHPHKSIGAGLRVGFSRSTKKIIRADFAYTDKKIWEFSLGTGQYFKLF